jgi:hypothetical protein
MSLLKPAAVRKFEKKAAEIRTFEASCSNVGRFHKDVGIFAVVRTINMACISNVASRLNDVVVCIVLDEAVV